MPNPVINQVKILTKSGTPTIADIGASAENITFDNLPLDEVLVDFTGATASTAGSHGFVPAPATGEQDKVLKGDGDWGVLSAEDITYDNTVSGLNVDNVQDAIDEHTHELEIATDSGTSEIQLEANSKYKITAGGQTFIFTTQKEPTFEFDTTTNALIITPSDAL